jgi:hypothetical protein
MQQITESNRVIFDQGLIDERNYWIARLTPVVEASKLDLDAAGAHPQLSEFNPEAISLNGEVYQRLAQLTGGGPFLTYTVLMTAMSICLQRYTGDGRVVIGSPSLKESDGSRAGNTLAIVRSTHKSHFGSNSSVCAKLYWKHTSDRIIHSSCCFKISA